MKKVVSIFMFLALSTGLLGCSYSNTDAIETEKILIKNGYEVKMSTKGDVIVINKVSSLDGWILEKSGPISYHNSEIHSISIDPRTGEYSESEIFTNGSESENIWNLLDPNATNDAKIELKKDSEDTLRDMNLTLDDLIELSNYKFDNFEENNEK